MPEIEIPMTQEEWDDSGSNFPEDGEITRVELGMPVPSTRSIKFPFTVTEGRLAGNTNETFLRSCQVTASYKKFSLEPILNAIGVPVYLNKSGKIAFDQSLVPGKIADVVWVKELDARPASEGGTGKYYTHARQVKAIAAESPL